VLPETFFKGIFRLPPGHYLTWKKGELEIKRYWEPSFEDVEDDRSLSEIVDQIDDVMKNSIEAHKISDTEVGSFLSSGVDSSYVAACCNVDKTFTVGFEYHNYNEISYAKELSELVGVKNISKLISTSEFWDVLSKVQYHMDEPLADPAAIALYFVSQIASEHVKVVLSGEGADELFGGYNIYREPLDIAVLTRLPRFLRKLLGGLAKAVPFNIKGKSFFIRGSKDVEQRFIGNANMFSVKDRRRLLKSSEAATAKTAALPEELTAPFYAKVSDKHDVTKMQYIDINFWLWGDILLKADRMSMAHSLELRVPFLDKEVFKVASRIPVKYKVNRENTKYAMRLAANKHIPEKVAQKKKLGFPVPTRVWLREQKYYDIVKEAFNSEAAKELFYTDELVKLLDQHFSGKRDNSRKVWVVFMFLVWYGEFFGKQDEVRLDSY
jgi:asparagine synthase (glutamine-hydrolysing)